jgi:hypothetical protein
MELWSYGARSPKFIWAPCAQLYSLAETIVRNQPILCHKRYPESQFTNRPRQTVHLTPSQKWGLLYLKIFLFRIKIC